MSEEVQNITISSEFLASLNDEQKAIFDKLLQQNNFLRESIVSVEESATERVATLNAELEDADNTIDQLENQIANLRVEVSKLEVQNEDLLEVVETATESAKLSMVREAQVNKDAEAMIKEKMEGIEATVSQAEANIEQKYTALLYEVQDERDNSEKLRMEVESELASTLVVLSHKTEANESLTKQVQQLEETKVELENEICVLKAEVNSDAVDELKQKLEESLARNAEFKDAVARIKWRSKEEIDQANDKVTELKASLETMENEQQLVSAELVRVMAERDSLEAEIEHTRLNFASKCEISDLDSLSGESESASANQAALRINNRSPRMSTDRPMMSPVASFKHNLSPNKYRRLASDRSISAFSVDDGAENMSIALDEHKEKLSAKDKALEDYKRKNYILNEEMENLRKQHTELIENNMLERKNREKLLKAAQKEATTIQKEYKYCQKEKERIEKELVDYLTFHKKQTEVKDNTISLHRELAKSRAANADLAKQLVESHKNEGEMRQLSTDLQNEVNMLLTEVGNLQNELTPQKSRKWSRGSDSSSSDASDDEDNDGLFSNGNSKPSRSSTDTRKRASGVLSRASTSSSDYELLKQMYLANALDSIEKRKRGTRNSFLNSPQSSRGQSVGKSNIRPRRTNTNLSNHYSPPDSDPFNN